MKILPKLLSVVLWMCLLSAACVAAEVRQWSVHEISLTAEGDYENPYTDVEVTAQFTSPSGTTSIVRGFWDGGRKFQVRFCPTATGEWKYSLQSRPPDRGLEKTGSFNALAPAPTSHGFLRRDAEFPTSFVFDDGTRYFMFGTTYYGILFNARAGDDWKQSISNITKYGMNKVRMYLHFAGSANMAKVNYPPSLPFIDLNPDRLDPGHWQAADRVVRFLAEHGVMADLILFPYRREKNAVATLEQDQRYLRYVLARYAAFPNVQWCLVNEWNYSVLPRDYWNAMGHLARAEDPWAAEGKQLRALSIHQQTRPDWNFEDQTWPSHRVIQLGVRNQGTSEKVGNEWKAAPGGTKRFSFGDQWGNYSIVRNWNGKQPVVNDEYGYIGEPQDESAGKNSDGTSQRFTREKHRHAIWGIYVGGGYAAAGDKNDYADGRPYTSATWHDVAEYGDIKRLIEFFTTRQIEYWKMAPHNELIKTGTRVYALAEPSRSYVIYAAAGGQFSVDLPGGDYVAHRFDPRTGHELSLPPIVGGTSLTFSCPDERDWVFRLSSSGR